MVGEAPDIHVSDGSTFRAGRHGLGVPRILGCLAPIVYVWFLPFLIDLHISRHVTFARRAPGVQTIDSLISTPQATGAMAATLFFPLKELWLPGVVLEHERWARPTLLLFQICFGVIVATSGIHMGDWRIRLELTFMTTGILHYSILFRNCHTERRWMCKVLLFLLTVSVILAAVVHEVYPVFPWLADIFDYQHWLLFWFQALSVTALALFPLIWHRDRVLTDRHGLVPIGHSFFSIGNSSRTLKAFGTLLPILYVWSLPLLASQDVFAHQCVDFPRCRGAGESVSDMICTPMATGAMAATFFWPMMHLWMPGAQPPESRIAYVLLVLFQVCFGLFLMAPVIYVPAFHTIVVSLFCCSAILHLTFMLFHCLQKKLRLCVVCLAVAILMLVCLSIINTARNIDPHFHARGPLHAWCFYVCEAIGLSAVALFPGVWRRKDEPLPIARVISPNFGDLIHSMRGMPELG